MKLVISGEFMLAEGMEFGLLHARSCLVSGAGVFSAVTLVDGGARYALVSIAGGEVRSVVLHDLGSPFMEAYDAPAPVSLGAGELGLVVNPTRMRVFGTDARVRREIPIGGTDVLDDFAMHGQRPRVTATASRGTVAGEHVVVLDEPIATRNPRYLAHLRAGEDAAAWTRITTLGPQGFPVDRFGDDEFNDSPDVTPESCIIGDASGFGDNLLVCVEGSDASSVPRYGADFFTITRVAADGTVAQPLYQRSGWKRQPGKHGIRGKISSSGRYVILTPVFSTGDWKGKQRLFDLATGEIAEPSLPRGLSRSRIIDHGEGTFWLSDGARRILCAQAELP